MNAVSKAVHQHARVRIEASVVQGTLRASGVRWCDAVGRCNIAVAAKELGAATAMHSIGLEVSGCARVAKAVWRFWREVAGLAVEVKSTIGVLHGLAFRSKGMVSGGSRVGG